MIKTPTPPDKDEQTPLSEESLREKIGKLDSIRALKKLMLRAGINVGDRGQHIDYLFDELVQLILQDRQAWGEQERTAGHRMEAYITWEKYAKQKKRNHLIDLHFADYLHRRFNDLTDQLIERTGNTNYAHYDYNAETGEPVERNTSGKEAI